jgi:hypothetical protein
MSIRHSYVCGLAFVGALAVAGLAPAQPVGPGPVGPGPVGPGPVGPGPVGPGPVGPGPVGPGPVGLGPIGPGPVGVGPGPMSIFRAAPPMPPMTLEAPAMLLTWGEQDSSKDREKETEQRERERETRAYDQGREYLDQGKYDRAIERFTDVVSMKGSRADGALYYKAWAQNKAGQRA